MDQLTKIKKDLEFATKNKLRDVARLLKPIVDRIGSNRRSFKTIINDELTNAMEQKSELEFKIAILSKYV